MTRTSTPEQKAARLAYLKVYRARPEVRERLREQQRRYNSAPETVKRRSDYRREYVQRIREAGVHTVSLVSREVFAEMLTAQRGVCAICHKPETKLSAKGRVRRLSIDHDHATGRIRALLCSRCNNVVGFLEDNPRLGEAAVAYMREQEGLAISWAMEEAVGTQKPLRSRRHRVEAVQRGAADAMERAVAG